MTRQKKISIVQQLIKLITILYLFIYHILRELYKEQLIKNDNFQNCSTADEIN